MKIIRKCLNLFYCFFFFSFHYFNYYLAILLLIFKYEILTFLCSKNNDCAVLSTLEVQKKKKIDYCNSHGCCFFHIELTFLSFCLFLSFFDKLFKIIYLDRCIYTLLQKADSPYQQPMGTIWIFCKTNKYKH